MPQIETARLCLRPFNAEDLDDLAGLLADPQVMRYIGQEGGQTMTRVATADILSKFIARWRERGFGHFAVLLKATPQMIGLCGLTLLDGTPELIYMLARNYWGQGYAAEAACACLRYGFEEIGCERIVALTRPENVASQRVLEKIGMRYERVVEHYGVVARQYALTPAEFQVGDSCYLFRRA